MSNLTPRSMFSRTRFDPMVSWPQPAVIPRPLSRSTGPSDCGSSATRCRPHTRGGTQRTAPFRAIRDAKRPPPPARQPNGRPTAPRIEWRERTWYDVYNPDGSFFGRIVLCPYAPRGWARAVIACGGGTRSRWGAVSDTMAPDGTCTSPGHVISGKSHWSDVPRDSLCLLTGSSRVHTITPAFPAWHGALSGRGASVAPV